MEEVNSVDERIKRLVSRNPHAQALGIEFVEGRMGHAIVCLRVNESHLNFNGTCHGGVIFTLADTAFGFASNSHGYVAAGIDAHITYQVAVSAGDVLTATAKEISRMRRIGIYRVDVTNAKGLITSTFTGTVYITKQLSN